MYILYCDETNLEEKSGDFFVYGGVAVPFKQAKNLSETIDRIRTKAKLASAFALKFNPAPPGFSHAKFIALKQAILEAANEADCIFFSSVILHDVATSPNDARLNEINRVLYHFDCFLNREKSHGLVLIDRFSDAQIDSHLRAKFEKGVRLPYAKDYRLSNIVGFHYSAIGQSHFASVIDILLGSLRFAINVHTHNDKERLASATKILELLSPIFLRNKEDQVDEISFFFSPKSVRADHHRTKYESLHSFLRDSGVVCAQQITADRTY